MNRIPKAVYTKQFCEEAVMLAVTGGCQCSRRLTSSNLL